MRMIVTSMIVVLAIALVGMGVLASPGGSPPGEAGNETPGASVSAAVAGGEADLEAEVEMRGFGHQLQQADSAGERADLIAERVAADEATLAELENRSAELEAELEAGNISHGEYQAAMMKIAGQSNAIAGIADTTANVDEETMRALEERGVGHAELTDLRDRAAQHAHDRAPGLGGDHDPGPPGSEAERGPPSNAGNHSDHPRGR